MPLVKMTSILKEVDAKKSAALAFDCYSYDSIEWVIEVGQELNLPVIIMLYPEMSKYMSR
jgi:fructose/tagatose bisphosphate aldolase